MNKIIFQIGLLGFFLSLIFFNLQNISLFEGIIRSFVVFIGLMLIALVFVNVIQTVVNKPGSRNSVSNNSIRNSNKKSDSMSKATTTQTAQS